MGHTFISGSVALDLAGTVGHRDSPGRYELLGGTGELSHWVVAAGLTDTPPAVDEAGLTDTRALREAIFGLARARLGGAPADAADLALLNEAAAGAPVTVRLAEDGTLHRQGDLASALASIARAAVELLGGPAAATLKACGASPCTRLYLDSSRRGTRRWCDMRECGNRAKAAAYRRRQVG